MPDGVVNPTPPKTDKLTKPPPFATKPAKKHKAIVATGESHGIFVNFCCCCISLSTGVTILGILSCIFYAIVLLLSILMALGVSILEGKQTLRGEVKKTSDFIRLTLYLNVLLLFLCFRGSVLSNPSI